jgi:hypothetical protein
MPLNRTNKANSVYLKKRRKAAVAKGACSTCCRRKPDVGRKTCQQCLVRRAERDRRAANPYCVRCFRSHPVGVHIVEYRLLPRAA